MSSHPFGRQAISRIAFRLNGAAAGDDLDEEDAEGIDVALFCELVGLEVLGVQVAGGPLDLRGDVGGVGVLVG